jgi:hypothetical protein
VRHARAQALPQSLARTWARRAAPRSEALGPLPYHANGESIGDGLAFLFPSSDDPVRLAGTFARDADTASRVLDRGAKAHSTLFMLCTSRRPRSPNANEADDPDGRNRPGALFNSRTLATCSPGSVQP